MNALTKYYPESTNIKKQFNMFFPIFAFMLVGFIYVSGLRDANVRRYLLILFLFFFVFILSFFLLSLSPKYNYYTIDKKGVHFRYMSLLNKNILWKDIDKISEFNLGMSNAVGILYKSSFNKYVFGRKFRNTRFGWDELFTAAYSEDGKSFTNNALIQLKLNS